MRLPFFCPILKITKGVIMKKMLFLLFFLSFSVQAAEGTSGNKNALKRQEASEKRGAISELETLPQKYADFKKWLNDKFGFNRFWFCHHCLYRCALLGDQWKYVGV